MKEHHRKHPSPGLRKHGPAPSRNNTSNASNNSTFLAETPASINKHDTVLWGDDPETPGIEVQFLRGSPQEYLKRAARANDVSERPSRLEWVVLVLCGLISATSLAGFALAFFRNALPWLSRDPIILTVLAVGTVGPLVFLHLRSAEAPVYARERLGSALGELRDQYTATIQVEVADDDLRDRDGTSPLRSAMERVTPKARDSVVALLDAGDDEAVEHLLKALIEEERDRLDSQRPAEKGSNETRIADITARVLKEMRRD